MMAFLVLACFLLGSVAIATGAAMIFPPAGIIAGGAALVILALVLILMMGSDNHP